MLTYFQDHEIIKYIDLGESDNIKISFPNIVEFLDKEIKIKFLQVSKLKKVVNFIKNDNKKEIFNLVEIINNTINILNATLKSNHINLILNLDNTISYDGYPNQLSQVILNIVNNAKDALQEKNQNDKQIEIKSTKKGFVSKVWSGIKSLAREIGSWFRTYFAVSVEKEMEDISMH